MNFKNSKKNRIFKNSKEKFPEIPRSFMTSKEIILHYFFVNLIWATAGRSPKCDFCRVS